MPLSQLRRRSPVHGLDRRNLGPAEVLAQSVSTAAPAAAMATVPAIVAATAGPGTLWSFAVATVVALLIGSCIGQFTRRMAAAGSLYSLTAQGLGPVAAFTSGAALLVGYGVLAMAALTGSAIYVDELVARIGGGPTGSPGVLVGVVCALALLATVGVLVRVRLSARVVLLVEAVSITVIVVVFLALLGAPPVVGGPPGPDRGLVGIAAGVLPALGAFIGFEAATAMGVEARRPFRTVPRVVQWTAAATGLLYLFAAYTQVAGFGGGLGATPEPVPALATAQGTPWLAVLLDVGIAGSFAACSLASGNALVRVVFSMARDGIAPAVLGVTHPRLRTPYVAIAVVMPVVAAVPAGLLAAGLGGPRVLAELLTVAVVGYLVAYLLVCAAAPLFLRRIGELTAAPVVATVVVVPILLAVLVAFVVSAWGGAVPAVLGALALAVLAWLAVLRRRRPGRLAGIGVYDETTAADVHAPDGSGPTGAPR